MREHRWLSALLMTLAALSMYAFQFVVVVALAQLRRTQLERSTMWMAVCACASGLALWLDPFGASFWFVD